MKSGAAESNFDWLKKEPFVLALSAGFFGFYSHAGFLTALLENKLVPRRVTGASAGALVASIYASGHSPEEIKDVLFSLKRDDFWDPSLGLGLLKGKKLAELLRDLLPTDFKDLDVPLSVSTFDIGRLNTQIFSEGVELVSAVRASCALPGLFQPVRIGRGFYVDGGVADDLALSSVKKNERVLCHFLQSKSQPNPFERWHLHRSKKVNHLKMLKLTERVHVGPQTLHRGRMAFSEAYEHALKWLKHCHTFRQL